MEIAATILTIILGILFNVGIIVIGYTTNELNRLRNAYVKLMDEYVDLLIKNELTQNKENKH